ncbi:glycosyl transferase [Mesorhizobium sp. BAC0120]|nr:glycosyl transferase [Mesorhizobium sp. BAC0120]MDW6021014.1 glycosyl transferase [Mesorhizobium sp. BAC0120]
MDQAPAISLLSNGRYSVMVTDAGSGWSKLRDLDVTRWREDATRDCWGQFCFVRDLADNTCWSIGKQPAFRPANNYGHAFHGDRAEFRCRAEDIDIAWNVCVAPDVDAEVRALTVTNHGGRRRSLEFTSYSEVCLNNRRADRAHPAFAKLFVETRYENDTGALFARRRPRAADQKPIWAVHVSSSSQEAGEVVGYETDRLRFLGRGRTVANPAACDAGAALSNTTGPVLDPVFCLRRTLHLEPGATARVAFATGAADDQLAVKAIAERYSRFDAVDETFSEALKNYRAELRDLKFTADQVALFNRLAGSIAFANPVVRQTIHSKKDLLDRGDLWSHGISGDLPIVLVGIDNDGDDAVVRDMTAAHGFSCRRGLQFDLVLFDARGSSSAKRLTTKLQAGPEGELVGKPGGIFVLSGATAPADHVDTIAAVANIVLSSKSGSLADQLDRQRSVSSLPPQISGARATEVPTEPAAVTVEDLLYWNGFGGFTHDGSEYVVVVDCHDAQAPALPPAPWTNVIANPSFGCLASEAGLGYSWADNSQMNRLTPWSNDPVSDTPGEVIYLRDEETGEVWTPTPLPLGHPAIVTVRHGQGYSIYENSSRHLHQELTVHVPPQDAVKILRVELTNNGTRTRHLSATYFAEWVLGTQREDAAMQIVCERDAETGAIVARNSWGGDFAGKLAFAAASQPASSATSDRAEFLGKYGSVFRPAALARTALAERFGALQDPCAALMVDVSLAPGESKEVVFVLGQGADLDHVRGLVRDHAEPGSARRSFAAISSRWEDILNAVQVSTPDIGLNFMVNRWLPYQVLACRVWARTGNYQSGGAYGFRDQLQDVMALVHSAPDETRSHILRAAARQFREGDVQHWWHPPSGIGVRTRMTDDLYFLPFVVYHYVTITGDVPLLDVEVPFIESPVLKKDQEEDFNKPKISEETGTVYEHCIRALEHGFRLGRHGLPLMGTGDWNDGMNKVGAEGKGESVWNGWFFLTVLKSFAEISASRGDESRAAWCRERTASLRTALEADAWDGAWYRRAYFDDGTPLGSSQNDECQIDAIPQAWAVISGEANADRASTAMNSVYERLVREKDGLIALFEPPFDKGSLSPGYIKGYVPGIRENGGQYTHAATWVVWAAALLGDGDRAFNLWNLINPISHTSTREQVEHYKVEPYVVTADVYGAPPHTGRGGWSWYTGSASWLYRAALEAILGLRRQDRTLRFEPCIPASWPGYELNYKYGSATYRIRFDNSKKVGRGVLSVTVDGILSADGSIGLNADGLTHDVRVAIGY